jgi:hypothetical protein
MEAENMLRQRQDIARCCLPTSPGALRTKRSQTTGPSQRSGLTNQFNRNRFQWEEGSEMLLMGDKSGDAAGRPSWRSSLLGDLTQIFHEKPSMKNS